MDANNRAIFSKDMKLIELIDADYQLLSVLMRLDIQLPFGDISVDELCRRYSMPVNTFLQLCEACSSFGYESDIESIGVDDVKLLLQYLRSSHRYYLESLLPSVEQGVESVLEGCSPRQSGILRKFYNDYAEEVRQHLAYEESQLFPYVESLCGEDATPRELRDFMAEHADICDKVDDSKSIVIKYLPEESSTKERCELLFNLFRMRDDLAKHTYVEMKILAPMVHDLERRLRHE